MTAIADLLTLLGWSQSDAAAALSCTRRDIRDALAGREPWATTVRDGLQAATHARDRLAHARRVATKAAAGGPRSEA